MYDLNRWYAYADAESTKMAVWSLDQDALYVVRFMVKGWAKSLPHIPEMWKLYQVGGALCSYINSYALRAVTLQQIGAGQKLAVLNDSLQSLLTFVTLDYVDTDDGTWIFDVVIRAQNDQTIYKPKRALWESYVQGVLLQMGIGTPEVHVMGIVTIHCGTHTTVCRANDPDEDPDPQRTAATETFWLAFPDLFYVRYTPERAAAKEFPIFDPKEAYTTWDMKKCVGLNGLQLSYGLHDDIMVPLFACSGGGAGKLTKDNLDTSMPPLPPVIKPAVEAVQSAVEKNQKLFIVGVFGLTGFFLAPMLRRMIP